MRGNNLSEKETIYKLACQFRNAIEKAKYDSNIKPKDTMKRFPSGCCADASDLLAYHLKLRGIHSVQINGSYDDGFFENKQNHVWLKLDNGLIIDITGDQFKWDPVFLNYNIPVYVEYEEKEDGFHKLFMERTMQNNYDFEPNENEHQKRMLKLYNIIQEYF